MSYRNRQYSTVYNPIWDQYKQIPILATWLASVQDKCISIYELLKPYCRAFDVVSTLNPFCGFWFMFFRDRQRRGSGNSSEWADRRKEFIVVLRCPSHQGLKYKAIMGYGWQLQLILPSLPCSIIPHRSLARLLGEMRLFNCY